MNSEYSDPTANAAIGAADKEWFRLVKLALRIREQPSMGYNPKLMKQFKGIYQRLMEESPEELELILKKKKQ